MIIQRECIRHRLIDLTNTSLTLQFTPEQVAVRGEAILNK